MDNILDLSSSIRSTFAGKQTASRGRVPGLASDLASSISENTEALKELLANNSEARKELSKLVDMIQESQELTGSALKEALAGIEEQMETLRKTAGKDGKKIDRLLGLSKSIAKANGIRQATAVPVTESTSTSVADTTYNTGQDTDGENKDSKTLEEILKALKGTGGAGGGSGLIGKIIGGLAMAMAGGFTISKILGELGFTKEKFYDDIKNMLGIGTDSNGNTSVIGQPGLTYNQNNGLGPTTVTRPDGSQVDLEENILDNTRADEILATQALRSAPSRALGRGVMATAATAGNMITPAVNAAGLKMNNVTTIVNKKGVTQFVDKTTRRYATKEAKEALSKKIGRTVVAKVARAAPKIVAKSIPVAGAIIGLGEAAWRLWEGDAVGAAMSAASGALGPITAISVGAADIAREVYKEVYKDPDTGEITNPEDDPLVGQRLPGIVQMATAELKKVVMGQLALHHAKSSGLYDKDIIGNSEIDYEKLAQTDSADQLKAIINNDDLSGEDMAAVRARLAEIENMVPEPAAINENSAALLDPALSEPLMQAAETMTPEARMELARVNPELRPMMEERGLIESATPTYAMTGDAIENMTPGNMNGGTFVQNIDQSTNTTVSGGNQGGTGIIPLRSRPENNVFEMYQLGRISPALGNGAK